MKAISTATKNAWLSGDYTGTKRPMARVTIQKIQMTLVNYDITDPNSGKKKKKKVHRGKFASLPFGQVHQPLELPNLRSISWSRSVDDPISTCTMEFFNTADPLPLGTTPEDDYTFDLPGWFTYNRGLEGFSSRWGFEENGWRGLLAPDRIIRSYEGYGFDATVAPDDDPSMYPSGVWLIDTVEYTAEGNIRVQCRDLARALTDQICFPPVVPWAEYPLVWEKIHQVLNPPSYDEVTGWHSLHYDTDSNVPYIDHPEITDAGAAYVSPGGGVHGHRGEDAFDGSSDSYWLSVGNQSWWSSAYEYVQGTVSGADDVNAVKVKVFGGPYHGYVSVKVDGVWKGSKKIPYVSRVVDTHADIKYVKSFDVGKGDTVVVKLPKTYNNVEAVRVTFTRLWNSGIGTNYKYRAAVKDVKIHGTLEELADPATHEEGNFDDYTDIVKWFLAWGGFYWPKHDSTVGLDFIKDRDDTKTFYAAASDPVLPAVPGGRVWGDFEQTGIPNVDADTPPLELGVDVWDKKTLLDCITYIQDIVSFLFVVGEDGGVIWRQPNVWSLGNFIWDPEGQSPVRDEDIDNIPVIDERQTLIDLTTKISSRNLRERVFIGNVAGDFGAVARGFQPKGYGTPNLRRVAGWTDQRFENEAECQRMADLITLRQLFSYRENSLTIAANPALQVDDQVRIYERITNEGFIHYIKGIESSFNLADGKWTYSLTTHWLGEEPFTTWAFNPGDLSETTQAYLAAMGKIPA